MSVTISNGILQISVKSLGAELTSLKTINDNLEFLWQGDSRYWAGQSTVLFPVIGGLPGGSYLYEGNRYEMKAHGFAKSSEFELSQKSNTDLKYKLVSSKDTYAVFPWKFEFYVTYTLRGNSLIHGFKIKNIDNRPMLFSVGAHPGFNCPLYENETMEDYTLNFETPETITRRIKKEGLLSGERKPFMEFESEKVLQHSLFYNDAVILDSVKSNWIEIRSRKNRRIIRTEFEGFPYLGIWSAKNDAPFVCIEPWFGIDSTKGDSEELARKEGLQKLEPSAIFNCSYVITLK